MSATLGLGQEQALGSSLQGRERGGAEQLRELGAQRANILKRGSGEDKLTSTAPHSPETES